MKRLRGVANDLLAMFVSRNNDVDGYGAPGVLFREAPHVRLELVAGTAEPPAPAAERTLERARAWLDGLLDGYWIAPEVVQRAEFTIRFDATDLDVRTRETWGPPFIVHLELIDDRGHAIQASHIGHCAPHDPARERRRATA